MAPQITISRREETPRWLEVSMPVVTIVASLLVGSVILLSININPLLAYQTMLISPLTSVFGVSRILIKLVPIFLAALAVYLPMRAGIWNIGAGGQIYAGGITAMVVALTVDASPVVLLPLMMIGAGIAGGAVGFIPGFLKAKWGVDEIIVSLMLTFIATRINNYLIRGPLQGSQNFPASPQLPAVARLPRLVGNLHIGILFPIVIALLIYYLTDRTAFGFEMDIIRTNPEAAEQAGISKFKIYVVTFAVGGLIAGLAGMAIISGTQFRLRPGFELGYGFTAIPIALLGRNGVARVGLAAVVFSLIFVGGTFITTSLGVPEPFTGILEALIILFLITSEFFTRFRVDWSMGANQQLSSDVQEGGV